MNPLNQVCKFEREIHELTEMKRQNITENRRAEINEGIRLKRIAIKTLIPDLNAKEAQLYALSKIDCTCGAHVLFDAIEKLKIDNQSFVSVTKL